MKYTKYILGILVITSLIIGIAAQWNPEVVSEVYYFNKIVSASGDTELIAANANWRIRVLQFRATSQSTTENQIYLKTSEGTDLWGESGSAQSFDKGGISGIQGLEWSGIDQTIGFVQTSNNNESVQVNQSEAEKMLYQGAYVYVRSAP